MEKLFHLKENNTTARTEIVAGLTTFMTMAYIIALNPNLLTGFGAEGGSQLWNGVFLATCIASAIGTLVMAFAANKPFAMAPGMGLNSFFAVVVANIVTLTGMSYLQSFQTALCVILIEGIVFIILSVLKVREKIVEAIPLGIRLGIAPAIGLMLLNIGIGSNAGVYSSDGGPFYVMRDFFGALTPSLAKANMGDGYPQMVLTVVTMFVGLFLIVLFAHKKIKGSVLLGMLCASGIYWAGEAIFLHTNPFASLKGASFVPAFGDMAETTLFKFDFAALGEIGWFTVVTLVITFCIIDMFDTIGTLVGTASRAGMVDKDGNMPRMREALLADAIGTVLRGGKPGIDQRFFEMGLSSLDLVTVQNLLEGRLHTTIPLMTLLEHTTIRSLAAWVDSQKASAGSGASRAPEKTHGTVSFSRGMGRAEQRMRRRMKGRDDTRISSNN